MVRNIERNVCLIMKKYEKVFQKDYEQWYGENEALRRQVAADPMRLQYHLMPETGWLNDPNGLCQFHGLYHIYYQFTPFEPTGELKLWGHFTTRDFVSYQQEAPVLFPDEDFDAHGVYSGSAFVENDEIHYFYTGNVKYFDREDYDYIMSGRGSNVVHVTSPDGFQMSEKELVLTNADYPKDMSCHVRDPKIIKRENGYFMVLGARDAESKGVVLVYHSMDMEHWSYVNRITTEEAFGYMWECPDLFEVDGALLLISCPQGVPAQGVDYANVHQCTVMPLQYDFETGVYQLAADQIHQLDRGFDFYAPQSFEDEDGRRILIGWMGIPDADYTNPTVEAGWQHALTMPRELHFRDGRLYQQPLEEQKQLRGASQSISYTHGALTCLGELRQDDMDASASPAADSGKSGVGQENDSAASACVKQACVAEKSLVYEAELAFSACSSLRLTLRQDVTLCYEQGLLTLDLGTSGSGRTSRSVALPALEKLQIFSDTTSLEIFVNDGLEVFTTRVYSMEAAFAAEGEADFTGTLYELKGIKVKA